LYRIHFDWEKEVRLILKRRCSSGDGEINHSLQDKIKVYLVP